MGGEHVILIHVIDSVDVQFTKYAGKSKTTTMITIISMLIKELRVGLIQPV